MTISALTGMYIYRLQLKHSCTMAKMYLKIFVLLISFCKLSIGNEKTNLVIFTDYVLGDRISHLVEVATGIAKNSENQIGTVRVIRQNHTTNWTQIMDDLQQWQNGDKKPDVVLDMTTDLCTYRLRNMTRALKIPTVSTNFALKRQAAAVKGWGSLKSEELKQFVQVFSPTRKMQQIMQTFQGYSSIPNSIVFDGGTILAGLVTLSPNFTLLIGYHALGAVHNTTELPHYIQMLNPAANSVFIFGSDLYVEKILEGTSKLDKHLFDDRISWWAAATEFESELEIPKSLDRGIFVLTTVPSFSKKHLNETMKITNTQEIRNLFNLDMILCAVRAFGSMKHENTKDGFRGHFETELEKASNFLGSYVFNQKYSAFQANLSLYHLEFLKHNQDPKRIATVTFDKNDAIDINYIDEKKFTDHMPTLYLNATIVVDPPFVMRNDSCIKLKPKNDRSLHCYFGYVVDVLNKILLEEKKIKIFVVKEDDYGSHSSGAVHDMAFINRSKNSKHTEISSLAQIGIGAFSTDTRKNRTILLSHPLFKRSRTEVYSLAFDVQQIIPLLKFSHLLKKLENQRYLEQLKETWFVEYHCKNCEDSKSKH